MTIQIRRKLKNLGNVLFFLILFAAPFVFIKTASAATCTCNRNMANFCVVTVDCGPGFTEQCNQTPLTNCTGGSGSCACIPVGATITAAPGCGNNNQNCCPGGTCTGASLSCVNVGAGQTRCLVSCTPGSCPTGQQCLNGGCVAIPGGATPPASSGPAMANCPGGQGIQTAIGCIPLTEQGIAGFFLKWGLSIGGGLAFILIVVAGYQIISSSGDPRKLQSGKELLTSAITGLVVLVFAAFILRFIGQDFLSLF